MEKVLLAEVSIGDRENLYHRSVYSPVVCLSVLSNTGFLQVIVE